MFLRIDDIGASSKEFEYYGKNSVKVFGKFLPLPELLTNFLFFKKFPLWSGWAKYKELSSEDWIRIINFLSQNNVILNVALTACWVNKEGNLIKFNEKFPSQTEVIKDAINKKLIYILNHGLTHCIPGKHMPMRFKSNQKYHREFSNYLNFDDQFKHLEKSQRIIFEIFGFYPKILVPPGNQYNLDTLKSMNKLNMKYIQCHRDKSHQPSDYYLKKFNIKHIDNSKVEVLHDKDIVTKGLKYFQSIDNFYQTKYLSMRRLLKYS